MLQYSLGLETLSLYTLQKPDIAIINGTQQEFSAQGSGTELV